MTKYVVTSGDYHIKTNDAGSIFLDTGNQIGQVYMTGNLVVKGTTTQVDATNLDLKDNIIVLNSGEQGAGVSLSTAGIEIDRGSKPNTQFVFDETVSWNDPVTQTIKQGGFKTRDINGGNIGLEVRSISTGGGDLYLINAGTGVISVSGTNAYENQVTDDDDIPNKKYVDVQIAAQVAAADFQKIRDGSSSFTQMVVADFETPGSETENIIAFNNAIPAFNNAVFAKSIQLGCVNGPTDFTDAGVRVENIGTLNAFAINADGQTRFPKDISGVLPVTFKLFVDKQLIFQGTVSSDEVFRLPSGYRSDTFEVGVSGSSRIRAIHIGETPYGLRTA